MILSLFDDLKKFFGAKVSGNVKPQISSVILTSMSGASFVTALGCILVTAHTYVGDNINCYCPGTSEEDMKAVQSYCFIASTFTLSNLTLPAISAHPGLGPVPRREVFPPGTESQDSADDGIEHHSYYQWVPFMLVAQSALLYLPYIIWNSRENDYLDDLIGGTHQVHVVAEIAKKKCEKSAQHFCHSMDHLNGKYLIWFVICEVLAVGIAIGNLFLTNRFLTGKFFFYGSDALSYLASSSTDPNNPLNQVFPKVGKCLWYSFGPSGTIQNKDAICVLPLNIANEKVYLALWVAYIALAAVTSLALLYHIFLFAIPNMLGRAVVRRTKKGPPTKSAEYVVGKGTKADNFILWCLQSYIVNFPEWIDEVLYNIKG